jgi:hypothetical protein
LSNYVASPKRWFVPLKQKVKNMTNEHQHAHQANSRPRRLAKSKLVLVGFLFIGGYFLFTEHRAHLGGALYYLPFLFLLACPLMHMFMHGGHGHEDDNSNSSSNAHKRGDA